MATPTPSTRKELDDYVARYRLLEEIQREESRSTPPAEKFRQYLSIMELADVAGWLDDAERG